MALNIKSRLLLLFLFMIDQNMDLFNLIIQSCLCFKNLNEFITGASEISNKDSFIVFVECKIFLLMLL